MPVITQTTYDILKDFGVPFATLVIGFITGTVSNTISNIYVAKRVEFNNKTIDIYVHLRQQIEFRSLKTIDINIHIIEPYISWRKRRSFRSKVEAYYSYGNNLGEYADGEFTPNPVVVDAFIKDAQKLLPFFSPR